MKRVDSVVRISDMLASEFVKPYEPPAKRPRGATLKVGWVVPAITPGSGGINTIARFARFLDGREHDVTIYIYEAVASQQESSARKMLSDSFGTDIRVKKIEGYEESDIVIATAWETAYAVYNLITTAHKFYLVQDYEPSFYGSSSQALLAERTYSMGLYGIAAGRWLADQLISRYHMSCDYFDFGVDHEIYDITTTLTVKQKKVCFYARPSTPRGGFELGVAALGVFNRRFPDYTIELFGSDVSNYDLDFAFVNRGVLCHRDLASLYNESVACLTLSLTNASLLPYELLACGCIPVVNDSLSNRAAVNNNPYVYFSPASPAHLAEALGAVVRRQNVNSHAVGGQIGQRCIVAISSRKG